MFSFGQNKNYGGTIQEKASEESKVITTLAHEPKTCIEQYLSYYISRLEPGYAVLITGDWGTGKTFQVKHALPDDKAHYVSLFGLNTLTDIEAQVFAKMFPAKAAIRNVAAKTDSTNVEIPMLGGLGTNGLASALTNVFIKNEIDSSKPLIFDDLERCSVEVRDLLGLINRYVEHHKCRVIVIAHDEKIVEGFEESKEKVFGQTLHVEPNIDAAFAEFNSFFADDEGGELFGDLMDEVLSVFRESETSSLRVLRHVVEDIRRLMSALEVRHLKHRMAMEELIRLFSSLAIETRSNRLERTDLLNRRFSVSGYRFNSPRTTGNQQEPPSIVKADSKYTTIDLSSSLLNDQVLVEMLIEGRFIPDHIRSSLNASAYFIEEEEAPPWQIVSNFDKLDDDDVEKALKKMDGQFAKREITESGEFLHIVALMMMMASNGLMKKTVRQITDEAKSYIDEILKNGRLPPRTAGSMWFDDFDGSYAGVTYWVSDPYKAEFKETFDYLIEARSKSLEETYPAQIPPLLDIVRSNGQQFFEKVCHTRNGIMEYEDIPILAHIPAKDFVDAWLASPKTGWYAIGTALRERSKAAAHYTSLKPETGWYFEVENEMTERAKKEDGLAHLRIIRAVRLMGSSSPAPMATKSAAKV